MPARVRVAVDHPVPEDVTGIHLHSLVSRWLDDDHWASPKPYSLVPMFDGPGGAPTFEVGLLLDDLLGPVQRGVLDLMRRGARLGAAWCHAISPPEVVAEDGWDEMWDRAGSEPTLAVTFETPTTFRVGRMSNPLPAPSSVFRSWAHRWYEFAPEALAASVRVNVAREPVMVSHLEGRTVEVSTPGRPVVGFVGTVEFRSHKAGEERRHLNRQLHALAAVAQYSGTGASTTSGLGVTVPAAL